MQTFKPRVKKFLEQKARWRNDTNIYTNIS